MRVERQVVAGERDVGVEQDPQALLHRRPDRARVEIPEQAVVAEHELRAVRGGTLEQLALSRDPRDDSRHLRGAGYLEAVRAVVGERSDLEQVVQVGDDLVALRHPAWHLILRSMAAKPSRTTG